MTSSTSPSVGTNVVLRISISDEHQHIAAGTPGVVSGRRGDKVAVLFGGFGSKEVFVNEEHLTVGRLDSHLSEASAKAQLDWDSIPTPITDKAEISIDLNGKPFSVVGALTSRYLERQFESAHTVAEKRRKDLLAAKDRIQTLLDRLHDIADMPKIDQDDAVRLRYKAKLAAI